MTRNSGKFALGAIIGAAVGILFAPKSGKETRQDIKAKAEEVKSDVEKGADVAKEKAGKIVDNVEVEAKDLKKRTKRAVKAAKKEFDKK